MEERALEGWLRKGENGRYCKWKVKKNRRRRESFAITLRMSPNQEDRMKEESELWQVR